MVNEWKGELIIGESWIISFPHSYLPKTIKSETFGLEKEMNHYDSIIRNSF